MAVSKLQTLLRRKMNFDYPASMRFRCIKGGICCGGTKEKTRHILLMRTEAEKIAKTTLQPISGSTVKIKDKVPYSYEMKKIEDGKCNFLENNCCTIYTMKPLICRFYPFELKIAHSRKYTFLYTSECSSIKKDLILSKNYFRKLFQQTRVKSMQTVDLKKES
jgi:Fe-S-cluster containining protein